MSCFFLQSRKLPLNNNRHYKKDNKNNSNSNSSHNNNSINNIHNNNIGLGSPLVVR